MSPAGPREKILCLAFKFLGDVVVVIPALRALRQVKPKAEIHLLVAAEALPLVKTLPWIDRFWGLPRTRGKARLKDSWPIIRGLRREKFDLSFDFYGNDRGAFLSLAAGAKTRYGAAAAGGFFGRRWCYHHAVEEAPPDWHVNRRHLHFLRSQKVDPQANLDLEVRPDPAFADAAARIMPEPAVVAHISTSKPLKEWPLIHWRALARLASRDRIPFVFASGPSARERALLTELLAGEPPTPVLPFTDLGTYLAVLARAQLLVSGDTGPMHFAAGLGVPTLSLWGPSGWGPSAVPYWAPLAPNARQLQAANCRCEWGQERCTQSLPCLQSLTPELVWKEIVSMLQAGPIKSSSSASIS